MRSGATSTYDVRLWKSYRTENHTDGRHRRNAVYFIMPGKGIMDAIFMARQLQER